MLMMDMNMSMLSSMLSHLMHSTGLEGASLALGAGILVIEIIKLAFEAAVGIPLLAFALALKHAVLLGDAVYFKLHPLIAYAESLFPTVNAPEWAIPAVLALALAFYSVLQVVLPFYLNMRVSPRAEYLLYTLVIAPLALAYLLDSAAGIAVWAVTLLLSRINVAFNFDRKLPTIEICGLAERYDFKVRSIPKPGYDRVAGINLGGFAVPIIVSLYLLHTVKGYVIAPHPLHGFFPVELMPYFIALMLFIAVLLGSAKESLVGIVVDVSMVAVYLALLFYVAEGVSLSSTLPELQLPGLEGLREWAPRFAFAVIALSVAGVDMLKGLVGELLRKRLPNGIYGGGCERDAVLAAPIIGSAMLLVFNSMDVLRTAGSIAGWATLATYVTAGVYLLIPITLGVSLIASLGFGLLSTSEGLLVLGGLTVAWIAGSTFAPSILNACLGIALFVLLPAVCMYLVAGAFALMEKERVEKDIESGEYRRLFSALGAEEERIRRELRERGLKGIALELALQKELSKVRDRVVEEFVNEAKDPDIRKIKMRIGLGQISYSNPLREKWERELEELDGKK